MMERISFTISEHNELLRLLNHILDFISKLEQPELNKTYLSSREVRELLLISEKTLANFRDSANLPHIKIKGKILYDKKDLIEYIESKRVV